MNLVLSLGSPLAREGQGGIPERRALQPDIARFESLMGNGSDRTQPGGATPSVTNGSELRIVRTNYIDSEYGAPHGFRDMVEHVNKASSELSNRYRSLEKEALDFGNGLDLHDPATAIKAIEHQAQMTTANLEFHFVLQSADDVRHTFRTLLQQQ